MKHIAMAGLVFSLALGACSEQPAAKADAAVRVVSDQPEAPTAKPCPTPDTNSACKADTHNLQVDFEKALAGDYQAQRNTAYSLSGASPYVVAQPIQACAWRKVILATRPADAIYADDSQAELDCGKLSAEERAAAEKIAAQIAA